MSANVDLNQRPDYDAVLQDIADYVLDYRIDSAEALDTARNCLMDTLGCGLLALRFPECTKHLGPLVEGTLVPHGARVPGTSFRLDPVKAAWDIGCIVRWLDYNDTWLAAEWGHPSDNLGGILAVADHLAETPGQRRSATEHAPGTGSDDHGHEIQGVIALENSFNRVGLDHVLLVKVASTAVCAKLMGPTASSCWPPSPTPSSTARPCAPTVTHRTPARASPGPLATRRAAAYAWRTSPCAARWASPACSARRSGFLRCPVQPHQQGPGDQARGQAALQLPQGYGSYVMENVLFKISFPPNSTRRPPPRPPCACIRW